MRKPRITSNHLANSYSVQERPFWDACKRGFEAMFAPQVQDMDKIGPHQYEPASDEHEMICPETVVDEHDWNWYVSKRVGHSNEEPSQYEPFHFEMMMYNWFCNIPKAKAKPIMLVHGRTGCGKTTFVRYFFSKYLRDRDPKSADKTYLLRVSFPVMSMTYERAEEDFDHTIYDFLIRTFTRGKYDLGDPNNLIEMACLEYPKTQKHRAYFTENPPPDIYPGQLRWLREIVLSRQDGQKENNHAVSDWADFNRFAIRYLCTIDQDFKLIIFLDNVDHLPAPHQKNAWLLARHKLQWIKQWKSVAFVLAVRSYMLANSDKEDTLQAYSDKLQQLGLEPPTLFDVLEYRKRAFFDPIYPKRQQDAATDDERPTCSMRSGGISIPLYCPNELCASLLNAFKRSKKHQYISELCNYDIRQGFEIAKAVFGYPFYNWQELAHIVYQQYTARKVVAEGLVSYERLLDAVIRRNNIIYESKLPFFDNIFMVDNSDHFSNSLCKWFILKIVSKRPHRLDEISGILVDLGHTSSCIQKALQKLLICNIITSPQGVSIEQHRVEELTSEFTTLCERYLEDICVRLFYLQAMAYVTPLRQNFRDQVPLPMKIREDSRTFQDRVRAAKVLLDQIQWDIEEQKWYIEHLNNKDTKYKCQEYMKEYRLEELPGRIKKGVKRDLKNVLRSETFQHIDKQELLEMFD